MIPAGILLPAWLTANAQTASNTFDYYVSTTGSDGNPGTLASPWAITSLRVGSPNFSKFDGVGKRIGLLPGTYDVSSLVGTQESNGALQFPGGTSATANYFGSSNASGVYQQGTATLDMKGASGLFGGHVGGPGNYDGPLIAHTAGYTLGNLLIDGLVITGFSYKGIRIGGLSSADGPQITGNVTIQNCEFTGGGHNSGDSLDNAAAVWMDGCTNWVVSNNLFLNNAPWSAGNANHLNAIVVGYCQGGTIQYNTVVNAGSIYGKSFGSGTTGTGDEGTIIQNNYVDASMYSSGSYGLEDFTGYPASGLTETAIFRNNIVLSTFNALSGYSSTSNWPHGFTTPVQVYSNTFIISGGTAIQIGVSNSSAITIYDNICTGSGTDVELSGGTVAILDYNLTSTSVSGGGSHNIVGAPTFVGSSGGTYAQQYQLTSSSPGKGAGRVGGVSTGAATDMGAWGNGATQIGCNLSATAGSSPIPNPPTLTVS
jgi:hypothetical protein